MTNDKKIKLKGLARAILRHDDGRVETYETHNMIVTTGFDLVIKSITGVGGRPDVLSHIAVGTGTTSSAASQTSLISEVARNAGTWNWNQGSSKFTISTTFPKGSVTALITEGGVFNAASGGVMFDRVVFETPFQGASDITYTQEFEFEVL